MPTTTPQYSTGAIQDQIAKPISQVIAERNQELPPNVTTNTTPTVSDVYKNAGIGTYSPTPYDTALSSAINSESKVATTPVDEDSIRDKVMRDFQTEIDATNQIYAQKLAEAKTQGLGRIGSASAIAGRSGTAGSDFAVAQNQNVVDKNNEIEGSIQAEQAAAIAAIMGKGRAAVADEIRAKREAQQKGLDSYLEHLGKQNERNTTKSQQLAGLLLEKNIDPNSLDQKTLKDTADSYGVSVNDILSAYTDKAKTKKTDDLKLQLDQANLDEKKSAAEKSRYVAIGNGSQLYDTVTGQVVANNPKTFSPKSGGSGLPKGTYKSGNATFTPDQLSSGETILNAAKGPDGYVDPAVYQKAYQDWTAKGALSKDFLSKYPPAKYVNPANDQLPDYLRAPAPKKSSGRSL